MTAVDTKPVADLTESEAAAELERDILETVHLGIRAVEAHAVPILRRLGITQLLFLDDGLCQQYIARPAAQFLDDILIKLFDRHKLRRRNVSDLFDRREAFLDENRPAPR